MKKLFSIVLIFVSFKSFGQQGIQQFFVQNKASVSCTIYGIATNPDALYSFRLAAPCYAGQCVRIREAGGSTESDFGFVNGFVDTAAIKTFIGSADAYVVNWYDQTGNGYTQAQSTTTKQPKIATAGVLIYGSGKFSMLFDGTDDNLLYNSFFDNGDSISLIGVFKRAGGQFVPISNNNSTSIHFVAIYGNATNQAFADVYSSPYVSVATGTATTNLTLAAGYTSTSSITVSNGTTTTTAAHNTYTSSSTLSLGSIQRSGPIYYNGYLMEAAAYKGYQIADRATIEGSIKTYYGL